MVPVIAICIEMPKSLIPKGWCGLCGVRGPNLCNFRVVHMKRFGNHCNIE